MRKVIKGGCVITMNEKKEKQYEYLDIVIDDDTITNLVNNYDDEADLIIDATNKIVMPGLINCHTHLGMSIFRATNDNLELDRKIGYIKESYNENIIEKSLKNLNYSKEEIIETILEKTSKIINIDNVKPIELSMIYEEIFSKYCPNYDVQIHNLYMNCYPNKEHFIIISYNNFLYSYNYTKHEFVKISQKEMIQNIEEQRIGIYLNEKVPFLTNKGAKAIS